MRISDWISYVCSSDLRRLDDRVTAERIDGTRAARAGTRRAVTAGAGVVENDRSARSAVLCRRCAGPAALGPDRKNVAKGKSVSVRVDLVGRRIIKKRTTTQTSTYNNWSTQEIQ